MRSLTITDVHFSQVCEAGPSRLGNLAIDPESDKVYSAIERKTENGLEIDIVQVGRSSREVLATFDTPALSPFTLPDYRSEVLDIHYFADDRSLAILLAGGDIATLSIDPEGIAGPVEIVGSIDSGIKAAAWTPDDEQLILVTGEDNVVCMSRNFDVIHEEPLRQEDFGEDKFINVGWGSKSTQFHGSLGKEAAKEPISSNPSKSHPTDDGFPTITFRGDCAYFAISSLDPYPRSSDARRQIRIYSRDASASFIPKLSATSESLPGLEGAISWRPSGNLISGLVRYGYDGGGIGKEGKWDIAMIERNGLRHGGFGFREDMESWKNGRVRGMSWNSDSEVLAIWLQRKEEDVVQLWTMKNYHYYLKQEIYSHSQNKRFRGFRWHAEKPLTLFIYDDTSIRTTILIWETYRSCLHMPQDTASVAVIDGNQLLLTPFRTQNTPPPLSSYQIPLPHQAKHVAFSSDDDSLAVLLQDDTVQVWDLNTRLPGPKGSKLRGGGKVAEPKLRWQIQLKADGLMYKQICCAGSNNHLLGVRVRDNSSVIVKLDGQNGEEGKPNAIELDVERILWGFSTGIRYLLKNGDFVDETGSSTVELCPSPLNISTSTSHPLIFALSPAGKLLAASLSQEYASTITIASGVTSFVLHPAYLIYTTSSHMSHYAALFTIDKLARGEDVPAYQSEWETRRVERGSILVTTSPSEMSLVMQMPRGNLETVHPRPLVLDVVRRDVLAGSFRAAFLICRKHRLDLNVLHDLDPEGFMSKLDDFVKQVPEVDYLNLFVSSLNDSDSSKVLYRDLARQEEKRLPEGKVNKLCDSLRAILEKLDLVKYVETILTTHVCKRPADYESGLRVLLQLQSGHPDIVEDAIKYIIFLSEVDKLYDVALGMYNFQLVLMIAQYSQKDPKEYLPFLRELKSLDKHEQRFRIDDHLERRESALRNLKDAGESRWEEASNYLARYELFGAGFRLWKDEPAKLAAVHELYGDYLYDRRDYTDSALSYMMAGKASKALKAYEKAHAWRDLFALALTEKISEEDLQSLCGRVSDYLASRGRHLEGSHIIMDYTGDVEGAVDLLCRGAEFSEALRLIAKHQRSDLIESIVHPGLDEAHEGLLELIEEMSGQLDKEIKRLRDLNKIRFEDPETFYIVDTDPDLEGVDVATNATTVATHFTRYTVAPTTVFSQTTKMTGQTNRTRLKASKRAAGKKGTADEYEYLLQSLGRLLIRVDEKSEEAIITMRHLIISTVDHKDLARSMQHQVLNLRKGLEDALKEGWKDREKILDEAKDSGGMAFGGDVEKVRGLVRPEVKEWKGLGLLLGTV